MKHNITIFLSVFGLIFLTSCKSTKYVPEGKMLLTKNVIEINGNKRNTKEVKPLIIQQPNSKANLWFYNWANKDYKKKWRERITKYSDSTNSFTKLVSLKQSIGWANFWRDFNKWIFKTGEEPVLLNHLKTKKTVENLRLYYIYQGYFNTKITYQIDTIADKKSKVIYHINTGEVYKIDTIKYKIDSPLIDSLYSIHKDKSFIKENQDFKSINFEKEAKRLTKLFRNAGVYHFSEHSINFAEIDSINDNHNTNVDVVIANRVIKEADSLVSLPYHILRIKKVNVYTDYSYKHKDDAINDSLTYQGLHFYAYNKINYKPSLLALSIFIEAGQNYSDINTELTRKHLRELRNFKTIKIKYKEIEGHQLIANILLSPSKQYDVKLEAELTHSNIKPFAISGIASVDNKNTLGRIEILKIGLQGSFINVAGIQSSSFFNAWELGIDASYKVPRFLIPFNNNNSFLRKFNPKTTYTLGTSIQKNIGLDKQRFTVIADYSWKTNAKLKHSLDLLNGQFIRNLNIGSFFNVYKSEYSKLVDIQNNNQDLLSLSVLIEDPLRFMNEALNNAEFQEVQEDYLNMKNIKKRYNIITEDVLVPIISYQMTYNTQSSYQDKDFSYLQAKIASSGLLTSVVTSKTNEDNIKQLFGINVAQYIKFDVEYRKHWDLDYNNILAFRTNIGIAIPYGNSTSIPFSRSYFAGGPNDIRAWHIYELGPGNEKTGLEFNVGNFKLLSNLEYRFNVVGSFKAAIFLDAGNIWDTTNSDLTTEGARFSNIKSLQNIALGSGFGLRYDFSFIVFRGDLGLKVYEPYKIQGERWFTNSIFNPVLNIGVNYPF